MDPQLQYNNPVPERHTEYAEADFSSGPTYKAGAESCQLSYIQI